MKYERFEDLPVWQTAATLYNRVLDLFEQPDHSLSSGFRNQLDRASLSVSNNVAEGFERSTTGELLSFLSIAKGSASEVRSMIAVVKDRPKLKRFAADFRAIRELAESCARQLSGWMGSVEESPIKGKRRLNARQEESRRAAESAKQFRLKFLRGLKQDHPMYNFPETRAARGENVE